MKKKILVLASVVYFACLIQSTILDYVEIIQIKPNFLLVVAVTIALNRKDMESAFMGLFCGLGMDILIGKAIGWYAICLFLVCFCIGIVNPKLFKDNPLIPVFFVFTSSIAVETTYYLIHSFLKGYEDIVFVFTTLVFPESVYNAVIALPVYPLISRIYKKLGKYNYVHTRL